MTNRSQRICQEGTCDHQQGDHKGNFGACSHCGCAGYIDYTDPNKSGNEPLRQNYFRQAVHYHVAARWSVREGLDAIAGPLAHHAVESYLKSFLALSMDERSRKRISHDLPKLWREFKARSSCNLDHLDGAIDRIDRFEQLRYPEEMVNSGMLMSIDFQPPIAPTSRALPTPLPSYDLRLTDLDAIANALLSQRRHNPATCPLRKDAYDALNDGNTFEIFESFPHS